MHCFNYDWRRSLVETLGRFLEQAEALVEKTGCKLQLACHSMGGIIGLMAINQKPHLFHSVCASASVTCFVCPHRRFHLFAGLDTIVSLLPESLVLLRQQKPIMPLFTHACAGGVCRYTVPAPRTAMD